MVDLKYIGHSAFEFKTGETSILVDPLVSVNPKYDYTKSNITDIFITHAHSDHVGEAQEIAKAKKATITAVVEVANHLAEKKVKTRPVNFGCWLNYDWGRALLNPAFKTYKEIYRPSIALLPIGGTYTMDVEHAVVAADWLGAKTVIPMHYNTFPEIQADLNKFLQLMQVNTTNCCILNPDEIK